jgi:hypothetical protein
MSVTRKIVTGLSVSALMALACVVNAPAASAADTGTCYSDRPCMYFYYNSNYGGAYFVTASNIPNLGAGFIFNYGTTGKGLSVKNNAASAQFRSGPSSQVTSGAIFYNSNYAGPCDRFGSSENGWVDASRLAKTYNNDASVHFYDFLADLPSGCKEWW